MILQPVSDKDLQNGIEDATQFLPNPSLPVLPWAEYRAKQFYFGSLPSNAVWTYKDTTQDNEAMYRHLTAIKVAVHLTADERINSIARLFTEWLASIEPRNF